MPVTNLTPSLESLCFIICRFPQTVTVHGSLITAVPPTVAFYALTISQTFIKVVIVIIIIIIMIIIIRIRITLFIKYVKNIHELMMIRGMLIIIINTFWIIIISSSGSSSSSSITIISTITIINT